LTKSCAASSNCSSGKIDSRDQFTKSLTADYADREELRSRRSGDLDFIERWTLSVGRFFDMSDSLSSERAALPNQPAATSKAHQSIAHILILHQYEQRISCQRHVWCQCLGVDLFAG